MVSNDGLRFDLRVVPPDCYGNLLQHFTGSKDHNVALREDAVRRGLSISEYGVTEVESGEVFKSGARKPSTTGSATSTIPPELRENLGELDAARKRRAAGARRATATCGATCIRTRTWSNDGKNTIEEMALAARARGYEYLALTDHSHYLRDGKLERQAEEIAALNERLAPFRILRGVEANITAAGEVDVPEEELARLDWVMASLHTAFDRNPTERVLAAMDNPHVDCIGHLTAARSAGGRPRMSTSAA